MAKFFYNVITKSVSSAILTTLVAVFTNLATNNTNNQLALWVVLSVLFGLTEIAFIVLYAVEEKRTKDKEKNTLNYMNISSQFLKLSDEMDEFISEKITYNDDFEFIKEPISYDDIDNIPKWNQICENIRDYIVTIKEKGESFGVNIILSCKKGENCGFYMPAYKYTDKWGSRSSLTHTFKSIKEIESSAEALAKKEGKDLRSIKKEELDKYIPYYYKLFRDKKKREIHCLMSKTEIDSKFNIPEDKKDSIERNQYIAIPIFYKENLFAMIQIISYGKSVICSDETKLKEYIDKFLGVHEQLIRFSYIFARVNSLKYLNSSKAIEEDTLPDAAA